jgi:hypothetical protein
LSTVLSLARTLGSLSWLAISVKLVVLQVIVTFLSSESNVTQLEGEPVKDGFSISEDDESEEVAYIEVV